MIPTTQEGAEQIVRQDTLIHEGSDHLKSEYYRSRLLSTITDALTTFAQARERAVWEAAAKIAEHPLPYGLKLDKPEGCSCDAMANEFRRRATNAEGKE